MKELYLDIGNSFLKMATRENSEWKKVFDGSIQQFEELCIAIESVGESGKLLVSSVRKDITRRLKENLPNVEIRELSTSDIPAEMLDYKTPATLGFDRFLVCLAAAGESKNRNVVVIDAGSACTIDLMKRKKIYCGGVIMPGVNLIKSAMELRLPELPAIPESIPQEWPGRSTSECMEWGVNGGFVMAIKGFLRRYRATVENPEMYVTGGDAEKIIRWIGKEEKLIHRKNLIWDGMEQFRTLTKTSGSAY